MQPEANFRNRVHRRLKKIDLYHHVHVQSMEAGNGTPDYYYEAKGTVLWVEYKVHPNKCSPKQERWIARTRKNGHRAWVASWNPKKMTVSVEMNPGEVKEMELPTYVDVLYGAVVQ